MKQLPMNGLRGADYARTHYLVEVENDVTLEDVLTPAFWAHHHKQMPRLTVVEIVRKDLTLDGQFRVVRCEVGAVFLRPLGHIINNEDNIKRAVADKEAQDIADGINLDVPEGYKVKHAPFGYYVMMTVPGAEAENLTKGRSGLSKAECAAFAREHHKRATTPVGAAA